MDLQLIFSNNNIEKSQTIWDNSTKSFITNESFSGFPSIPNKLSLLNLDSSNIIHFKYVGNKVNGEKLIHSTYVSTGGSKFLVWLKLINR